MQKILGEVKTSFEAYKASTETKIASLEDQVKKAETEKEEIKKKISEGPNNEGKNAKFHKAMKAAMDEKDESKKAEAMKEAMKHYKAEDDSEDKKVDAKKAEEEKEEKEAMKAELAKSRLQVLTAAYKNRVDEKTLTEYTAQWNKQSFKQLDAEIEKIKPFIGKTIPKQESQIPLSPMGSTMTFSASKTDDEYSAKVDKMTVDQLFNGGKI